MQRLKIEDPEDSSNNASLGEALNLEMEEEEFLRRLPFDKLKIYPNQDVFELKIGTKYPSFKANMLKAMWDDAQ